MTRHIRIHWPGILILVFALVTGLSTYQDYGVNWDDPYQRVIGQVNYDYITKNDTALRTYEFKEYGPSFELLLVFIEKGLKITDSRDIFLMRHIATHIFFLVGTCCFYLLAFRLFKNRSVAAICLLMVIFSPRIYAHSFFNSKDIPFFAAMSMSLYACTVAFQKKQLSMFLIAGIVCGFATSIRVMGIMLLLYTVCYLLLGTIVRTPQQEIKASLRNILVFCAAYFASLYICFPFLWQHPVDNFVHCFSVMSHYTWKGTIFQNGQFIQSDNIPWYVFLVWFVVTNPLAWLATGFAGIISVGIDFIKKPIQFLANTDSGVFIFILLCFFTPVIAVVALHSVIYEDWRHLFFVYPPFVIMAGYFIHKLYHGKFKIMINAAIIIQVVVTGYTMYKAFPLNQVYFNPLVSHKSEYLRKNFEMDYWGVSFKLGLDHILATDTKQIIIITADRSGLTPLENNVMLLTPQERARVHLVNRDQPCDYLLTDFRCHPEDYDDKVEDYSIKAFNSTVLRIYKPKK